MHWLDPLFPSRKSNWGLMEGYESLHPTLPSTSTDCPVAHRCPDPGLGRDPLGHHLPTCEEHAQMLSKLDQPVISLFQLWFPKWFWIQPSMGWWFWFPLTFFLAVNVLNNFSMILHFHWIEQLQPISLLGSIKWPIYDSNFMVGLWKENHQLNTF